MVHCSLRSAVQMQRSNIKHSNREEKEQEEYICKVSCCWIRYVNCILYTSIPVRLFVLTVNPKFWVLKSAWSSDNEEICFHFENSAIQFCFTILCTKKIQRLLSWLKLNVPRFFAIA
ncbi:hypothetical protein ACOSP7_030912 [Xanthoceras sorbifolium]